MKYVRRRAISSQLRHVSTIGKKFVKQQYVLHMAPQYSELLPTSGWDRLTSLGHPCNFQRVPRLGSVTAWHLVVGVSQTIRRWTEGATYIWQGDHHVGHWPTFLVTGLFHSTKQQHHKYPLFMLTCVCRCMHNATTQVVILACCAADDAVVSWRLLCLH